MAPVIAADLPWRQCCRDLTVKEVRQRGWNRQHSNAACSRSKCLTFITRQARGVSVTCTQSPTAAAREGSSTTKGFLPLDEGFLQHATTRLPVTRSATTFVDNNVEYLSSIDGIDLQELNDLFNKVGFPKRDLLDLQTALDNTHLVHWVRATKSSRWARDGQLIGFARATSDRAFFGTIWDVAVLPSWQKSGLGKGLVERLVNDLLDEDIPVICLFAESGVIGLYERLGFEKDFRNLRCMAYQHPRGSKKAAAFQSKS